ncbi:MAG: HEPN domain-containing protein [Burkholderiales bacterium]|nr:HEPN domain-containing protein [Burkholderiales bacterium]
MNSPREHALALLARARDDLYVVRRLCGDPDAPGWVLGFHAQQGVEKALKAVLSAAGVEYPRTHNLVMLAELLRGASSPVPLDADDLGVLVPFGVALRYEVGLGDEPPVDADRLEAVVSQAIDWATGRLGESRD